MRILEGSLFAALALVAPSAGAQSPAPAFVEATATTFSGLVAMGGNTHSNGAAVCRLNRDELPDIVFTAGSGVARKAYLNAGTGSMIDISGNFPKNVTMQLDASVYCADLDNDGLDEVLFLADGTARMDSQAYNDLYLGSAQANQLFQNDGDGTFTDVSVSAGIVDPSGRRNTTAAVADFDGDGFLDLFLAAWAMNFDGRSGPIDKSNRLLFNQGNLTFLDVTAASGTAGPADRDTLVAASFDVNVDGAPDLFVGNVYKDFTCAFCYQDELWTNDGFGGVFSDGYSGALFGSAGTTDQAIMGVDVLDVDLDGLPDVITSDVFDEINDPFTATGLSLYLNDGAGGLSADASASHGLQWDFNSWAAKSLDFDLDGDEDLVVSSSSSGQPTTVLVNDGAGQFSQATSPISNGLNVRSLQAADLDLDFDEDLIVVQKDAAPRFYRNDTASGRSGVAVRLRGTASNAPGIGAEVKFLDPATGAVQRRWVLGQHTSHGNSSRVITLGPGSSATVDVEVTWPSGAVSSVNGLAAGSYTILDEDVGAVPEALTVLSATWDPVRMRLTMLASSTHNGAYDYSIVGKVGLTYDALTGVNRGTFRFGAKPTSVVVQSTSGAQFTIAIP
jgi:FG-GAP-like repeat/ASPIC and UnbV